MPTRQLHPERLAATCRSRDWHFAAGVGLLICLSAARVAAQDPRYQATISEERPEIQVLLEKVTLTAHKHAVWRASQKIIEVRESIPEIKNADPLTAEIAAFLHDVGGGGAANAKPGAEIAAKLLTKMKLDPALVNRIARIVETHHVTNNFRKSVDDTPEWRIVLLADSPAIYPAFMLPEELAAWKKRSKRGAEREDPRAVLKTRYSFIAALQEQLKVIDQRADLADTETPQRKGLPR